MADHPPEVSFARALVARHLIELYKAAHPSDSYAPHDAGQIQFHRSKHIIRALFPGNGFGKTRCIAEEAHAWCTHSNRWQTTPAWPVDVVWVCPDYQQFGKLQPQLEGETIGDDAKFVTTKLGSFYRYADGSRWWVTSADRSWKFFQGINPDLILFDEVPPIKLWREAMMRRRGRKLTRYGVAATATEGISWMEGQIYEPWLDHHRLAGYSMEAAVGVQRHPYIWCQPYGSAADNPANGEDVWDWYNAQTWGSEKEKQVRLFGGFADFTGDGVFDEKALTRIREGIAAWRNQYPDWPIEGMLEPELAA